MKNLKRWQFYLLSFTWGLPMSLMGLVVCAVLMCFGKRPKRYGHCYYMSIGKSWGGLEFGWFFLTDGRSTEFIKRHELGHGYQNACILGWLYPIFWFIAIARYWLKRWGAKFNYYGWWLEDQANKIGQEVMKR
jgi:hypothetical protein